MTVARQVVAGRTQLISRRCTQRQCLLRPDPEGEVKHLFLYLVAEAAQRYGITLLGYVLMSNHQHILARDNHANFPEFLCHLDKMIAKVMNWRLDRAENFWNTQQPNAVYCVEAADRFAKLIYLLANPVAADLVERVSEWPGACSLDLSLSGRSMIVKRPRFYFGPKSRMPEEVTLRVERPDGFEELTQDEWAATLTDAVQDAEERERERRRREGIVVLGPEKVMRIKTNYIPPTKAPRGGLRPHIACRNSLRRQYECMKLVAFRISRTKAVEATLAGELMVLFPRGTYRIRGFFLAPLPIEAAA